MRFNREIVLSIRAVRLKVMVPNVGEGDLAVSPHSTDHGEQLLPPKSRKSHSKKIVLDLRQYIRRGDTD